MATSALQLLEIWLSSQTAPHALSDSMQARERVARALAELVQRAQQAWPMLGCEGRELVTHLAQRQPATMTADDYLGAVNSPDLLLALCCARADEQAIAAFNRRYDGDLRMVYAQSRGDKPPFDEYAQSVRTRLLTGPRPRILDYAGVGELKNWLRVSASRVLIDLQRARPSLRPAEDHAVLAVPAPDDDPETEYLKKLYRQQMREAFEEATALLNPEERNCLRDYYARRMTIDELAAARGVHRATAARRVANARSAVLRHTRQLLMRQTRLSQQELASVVRLIESQLYVSVERVFESAG